MFLGHKHSDYQNSQSSSLPPKPTKKADSGTIDPGGSTTRVLSGMSAAFAETLRPSVKTETLAVKTLFILSPRTGPPLRCGYQSPSGSIATALSGRHMDRKINAVCGKFWSQVRERAGLSARCLLFASLVKTYFLDRSWFLGDAQK
jgi:hypothetical protein